MADDTFELYAVRHDSIRATQPTFTIFPDAPEYASQDHFVKRNPISIEQYITSSNIDVAAVLLIGAQGFQAGLLVETKKGLHQLSVPNKSKSSGQQLPS